jgi:hypothetical protein
MTDYGFHLDRTTGNFSITKDDEFLGEGSQAPSLSTYAFRFQDVSANEYEMVAKGFFWWRRMQLFKNGSLDGSYTRTKAVDTGVEFGRRDFIRRNGEYLHHIDRCRKKSAFGLCLYNWSGTPPDIEIEVIALVIMSFIQSKQGLSVTAVP